MVTQEDELMDLLQDLKTQTEIAVDLEVRHTILDSSMLTR